jgi:hypothetical protein
MSAVQDYTGITAFKDYDTPQHRILKSSPHKSWGMLLMHGYALVMQSSSRARASHSSRHFHTVYCNGLLFQSSDFSSELNHMG